MKLPWRYSADLLPGNSAAGLAEADRLIEMLRAAHASQVSDGLEGRVQAMLQTRSRAVSASQRLHVDWSRRWATAGVAASLVCVFTGGLLVSHYSETATHQPAAAPVAQAALPTHTHIASPQGTSLATAAARRKPASPVSVGRRKGRARSVAAATPSGSHD